MRPFAYASARTKEEAIELLGRERATLLAGGTDLLSLMKNDVVQPELLVNLKSIEELRRIREVDGGLEVGATVTLDELAAHPKVRKEMPAIAKAIDGILSPQIRAMGTVGGDLCQRPRCWYYRAGFGLLAQHNGRSMVEAGDNRYHAIFGDGPARFVSPSSLGPVLVALRAELVIEGVAGKKRIPVSDFFRTPSTDGEREHALQSTDLVTEIFIADAEGSHNGVYEVRNRQALDWPLVSAAVSYRLSADRVRDVSVVLGHVAPQPWLCVSAAEALEGKRLDDESAAAAGHLAVRGARPLSRNGYKVQLSQVAVKRALLRASGREV